MDFKSVQYGFAAHLRDPDNNPPPPDVEDRRMGIYRDLFFNNIKGFIANSFPVVRKLHSDAQWDSLIRKFFSLHQSHTPLFPELPREFLQFLEDHPPEQGFLLELAHYEWAELAVQLDEAEIDDVACDPDGNLLQMSPVKSPVAWLLSYRYPVHRIRPEFQPQEPSDEPHYLVVYRRRDDKVKFMEVNAITAKLLHSLETDTELTGEEHLAELAKAMAVPVDQIRANGLKILEDFRDRHIVVGAR